MTDPNSVLACGDDPFEHTRGNEVLWVDPKTGEASCEQVDGWVPMDLSAEERRPWEDPDPRLYGDWATEQYAKARASKAALQRQHKRRLAREDARLRYLDRYVLPILERSTAALLGDGRWKEKHVRFSHGDGRFRKATGAEVTDEDAAIRWADKHCPSAVAQRKPKLLKSELPAGQKIPGVVWPTGDRFTVGT